MVSLSLSPSLTQTDLNKVIARLNFQWGKRVIRKLSAQQSYREASDKQVGPFSRPLCTFINVTVVPIQNKIKHHLFIPFSIINKFSLQSLWLILQLLEGLETRQGLGVYTKRKQPVANFTTKDLSNNILFLVSQPRGCQINCFVPSPLSCRCRYYLI